MSEDNQSPVNVKCNLAFTGTARGGVEQESVVLELMPTTQNKLKLIWAFDLCRDHTESVAAKLLCLHLRTAQFLMK